MNTARFGGSRALIIEEAIAGMLGGAQPLPYGRGSVWRTYLFNAAKQ